MIQNLSSHLTLHIEEKPEPNLLNAMGSEDEPYFRVTLLTLFITVLLAYSDSAFSQRNADIGAFGGTSYYVGELNPNIPFVSPRYSFGPILRYNFNARWSLRGHIIYASITGADIEANQFITKRNFPVSFTSSLVNIGTQMEFNFLPYESYEHAGDWTPYIFGGLGYSLLINANVNNSDVNPESHLTLPFGVGLKLNLTRRLSSGLEWSHHKTFTSSVDGVTSPLGKTFLSHNDWYSFFGLFITYKFFKFAADCPVYN